MMQPPRCSSGPRPYPIDAYDGEFGYELYQGVPRVWAQCSRKQKPIVHSVCDGMQPFYRFADLSFARPVNCSRLVIGMKSFNQGNYTRQHLPPDRHFKLPPYREMYKWEVNATFAYVFNKKGLPNLPNYAPSGRANSWNIHLLIQALGLLHQRYDYVVYFRPGATEVDLRVPEGDTKSDRRYYPDFEMIRRYSPKTLLLHELVAREGPEDRTYLQRMNVAQLLMSVNAQVVVGTQGGLAVLAGQTSKNLYFLCRAGHECTKDVRWWRTYIPNSTIVALGSEVAINHRLSQLCVGIRCSTPMAMPVHTPVTQRRATIPRRTQKNQKNPRIVHKHTRNHSAAGTPRMLRVLKRPPPPPPIPAPGFNLQNVLRWDPSRLFPSDPH